MHENANLNLKYCFNFSVAFWSNSYIQLYSVQLYTIYAKLLQKENIHIIVIYVLFYCCRTSKISEQ